MSDPRAVSKAKVCVGGPHDGKLLAVEAKRREVRVPIRSTYEFPVQTYPAGVCGGYPVEVHDALYISECIATPGGEIWFWRHDGMSQFDAVAALVSHYATKGREDDGR